MSILAIPLWAPSAATLLQPLPQSSVRAGPPLSGPCGPDPDLAASFGVSCEWQSVHGPAAGGTVPTRALAFAGPTFSFATPAQCCCATRDSGDQLRCLPHAIIIGAQKAGTTALFGHFLLRPDFVPPDRKETHYFDGQYKETKGGRDGDPTPYLHLMKLHHAGMVRCGE